MESELFKSAYKQMLYLRLSEERLVKEYLEKGKRSFLHSYIGQEAVAIGVSMNLSREDYMFGNHRSHGHYLAKGGDLKKMIAELYGKAAGCARGRGGSMHVIDKSVGFMGSICILGSVISIATGAAFSIKLQEKKNICVVFLGDGATEEGSFYESVNFAALFKLPIVFVVENNLYAVMSDASARRSKDYNLQDVATGLGASYYKSDGNNVIDVYDTAKKAIAEMVEAKKPAVIEYIVFRHMAHSGPILDDKMGYRKKDDQETRLRECSIKRLKGMILERKLAGVEELDEMELSLKKEIDEAVLFAEQSPYPEEEEIMEGLYCVNK